MLGLPLERVTSLSADEMAVWNMEMRRRPPEAVEILLANILLAVVKLGGGEKAKRLTIRDVAPWLDSAEEKRRRDREEEDDLLSLALSAVEAD